MIDRRVVLTGATTFASAASLIQVAEAETPAKDAPSDRAATPAAAATHGKRNYMAYLVTEVEMVGGGSGIDLEGETLRRSLEEELRKTIQRFSRRNVQAVRLTEFKLVEFKN